MFKLMFVVLALVAVAAAQYLPYAYNAGIVRSSTYHGGYAAAPVAYSGAGLYNRGYASYGAYPYLG